MANVATQVRDLTDRRDARQMPKWARDLLRRFDDIDERLDGMTGRRRRDYAGQGESPVTASEGEQRRLQRSPESGPDRGSGPRRNPDLEDGRISMSTSGQRRDRQDARLSKMESETDRLRRQVLEMFRQPSIEDRNAMARARSRADSVYVAVGRPTPDPVRGERAIDYRARLVHGLKDLSPSLRQANLGGLRSDALGAIETQVYQDAMTAVQTGKHVRPGELRANSYTSATGHQTTEYHGDPINWLAPFMAPGTKLTIKRNPGQAISR